MPAGFDGLHVVAFESRRAEEMGVLIARHGGRPLVAPTMREVPLREMPDALAFARRLLNGEVDVVILLTGVGTRTLAAAIDQEYPRERWVEALGRTTIVARGPKPVAALRELGLTPTVTAPEPNTWRELLAALDQKVPLQGQRVAVQEYGESNSDLLQGLRQRGAEVTAVPVYQWALPEDLKPLKSAIRTIVAGEVDVALCTSANQVRNLFQVAADMGLEHALRDAFRRMAVGSIGPTCSDALRALRVSVEFEPDHVKMGDLVRGMARASKRLVAKKRVAADAGVDTTAWRRADMVWAGAERQASLTDSVFLRACRREPTSYTPIWLLRQAGRYQREYRELRAKVSFLDLCKTPELAAEVTLMAVDRLDVDAAIIFSDILLLLEPMGIGLEFAKGEGPVIHHPVRTGAAVDQLAEVDPQALEFVYEAIRLARRALPPSLPLIGFAGGPFTLASYGIEGGGSRHYEHTKTLMYRDSGAWHALMEKLARAVTGYLNGQIAAGAQAVQVFDSWVGCLSPDDYREFVLPHSGYVFSHLTPGVPAIHFGTDTATLLELMRDAGGGVIGLDWRIDLAEGWVRVGYDAAVQGNLDPVILFAPPAEIRRRANVILEKAAGRPGHIFNLGHGILPETPEDNVLALVDAVHEYTVTSDK